MTLISMCGIARLVSEAFFFVPSTALELFIAVYSINEPPHEKTNNLHMRNERRRSASQ